MARPSTSLEDAVGRLAIYDAGLAQQLGAFFRTARTRRQVADLVDPLLRRLLGMLESARRELDPQDAGVPGGEVPLWWPVLPPLRQASWRALFAGAARDRAVAAYGDLVAELHALHDAVEGAAGAAGIVPTWRRLAAEAPDAPVEPGTLAEVGRLIVDTLRNGLGQAATLQHLAPLFAQVRELTTLGGFLDELFYGVVRGLLEIVQRLGQVVIEAGRRLVADLVPDVDLSGVGTFLLIALGLGAGLAVAIAVGNRRST